MNSNSSWTAADVPPGPYFHGTMFPIKPEGQFDLTVPRSYAPENDWGVVNNQEGQADPGTMFWATTDEEAALRWGARYQMRFEGRLDRVYVWEVDLEDPKVDVNAHDSARGLRGEAVTNVMAASGRFLRLVQEMSLAEYRQWERMREARLRR
jgi:hypothetical protein